MIHSLFRLGLTARIVGLILVVSLFGAWLQVLLSEDVIEGALLEAAKKQALAVLSGVEHEITRLPDPSSRAALQELVEQRASHREELLDFSILSLYIFSLDGEMVANSSDPSIKTKDVDSYKRDTLERGEVYLGDEVERYRDPATGAMLEKVDVILPAKLPGIGTVGIEMEIGLAETRGIIRGHDDKYEGEAMVLIGAITLITVLLIGWTVHRGLIGPINRIEGVTARIADGELDARVTGRLHHDELGRLGGAVNHMAERLQQLMREQEQAYLQMMQSLAKALEAKDSYTAGHSARVAKYAVKLAQHIGMAEEQVAVLKRGALMHDLGKIGIPDAILNKPSALSDAEYEEMQKHPVYTAAIMRPLKRFKEHAEIAAWHHERWDGKGYPDGLAGEAIPLMARIVAIADTWDAMTGDRVYRKGMPREKAIAILSSERESGQFEPGLLDAFLAMVSDEGQVHQQVQEDIARATG
ncbi:HD domain-containing phosphohydrolase [Endothiovibrio diazotrophicus]